MHRNPVQRDLVELPELWRMGRYCALLHERNRDGKNHQWEVLKMKIGIPAA